MRKNAGNPQWGYETCKECGRKNIPPEKDIDDRWRYPRDLTCVDCLEKREKTKPTS
jgi:ferredoxin-like protein FixX